MVPYNPKFRPPYSNFYDSTFLENTNVFVEVNADSDKHIYILGIILDR